MSTRDSARYVALLLLVTVVAGVAVFALSRGHLFGIGGERGARRVTLYWFIPDGLRADPATFKMFEWARQGLLPNIKKMMDQGAYGYSKPVFPGHTPTNFATLLTGSTPKVHGVADGSMHIEGYPLQIVSKGGFSSVAKNVPPIWYTLERQGDLVSLLSVPGSTPPELSRGITIRGRWGGWGLDFPAINFHSDKDAALRVLQGPGNKLFEFGSELTKFTGTGDPAGWRLSLPRSFSRAREVTFANWGSVVHGLIYDSSDDGIEDYDRLLLSLDKSTEWARLKVGEWSDWLPITLRYETNNDYNIHTPKKMAWERDLGTIALDTRVKVKVIKLGGRDFFRVRFVYDNLNRYSVKPSDVAAEMAQATGPMVDFVDNFPPQLIYYDEDKATFLEEARMSLDWHRKAVSYLIDRTPSDVVIHDTYTPNQMLTSRWWLGYVDPKSRRYDRVTEHERAQLWKEVIEMYQGIDAIMGEILARVGPNGYVVLSSDHGAVPLDREVRLNNLLAAHGLLKYAYDRRTGEYQIDWKNTKAVFLSMDNIFLDPDGLDGNYKRAHGPAYEALRDRVIALLRALKDERGTSPLAAVTKWEDANFVDLPKDRVGDLIIANVAGYGWVEDLTEDGKIFVEPRKSGYKQGVIPDDEMGMWTPFVIVGPGVKKNHQIDAPIHHIDQYPTIMTLIGRKIPSFVEGRPVKEIFAAGR